MYLTDNKSNQRIEKGDNMFGEVFLLSDVGGTNVRFALYREGVRSQIIGYPTQKGKEYTDYISQFLHDINEQEDGWTRPTTAIIGAAGLIKDGVVHSKNCPFVLDQKVITKWGFNDVIIENDFVTQSRAVKSSNVEDFIWNTDGEHSLSGTVMVVGPGTGLGMSIISESSKGRMLPSAAEAGFTTLPKLENASETQNETIEILRNYMERVNGSRLVYDQVVSGTGMVRLYYARKHVEELEKNPDLIFQMPDEKEMPEEKISAQRICELADNGDEIAQQAVDYFMAYLGRFTGDQANSHLPDKIVFSGGVMCDPYLQKRLFEENSPFMQEYEFSRLKAGNEERPMAIAKNRAVAFNGLQVAADEIARKHRDNTFLKMRNFFLCGEEFAQVNFNNAQPISQQGNISFNTLSGAAFMIDMQNGRA